MTATIGSFFGAKSVNSNVIGAESTNVETMKVSTSVPWVEKYRPKNVSELVYQDEVVAVLKKCIEGADLPNLLFYGPPGTGKTSAAVALCRQLFKSPQLYKDRVLEMNASDERGIDVVRHRIKEFSRLAVSKGNSGKNAGISKLKVVILDEADAMTNPAQAALRRTMENETQSTRFFLICNYITKIIEPLTSRCAKFRFKPLAFEAQKNRLLQICDNEHVSIEQEAIDQLVNISNGDLRKSITLLQSMACSGLHITNKEVREMSGYVPESEIETLMKVVKSADLKKLMHFAKHFTKQGFSAYQVISQLTDILLLDDQLNSIQKAKIFEKIGSSEKQLLDGADEFLQLIDVLSVLQNCFFEVEEN